MKKTIYKLIIALGFLSLLGLIFIFSKQTSPFTKSFYVEQSIKAIFPQGWAFFTRNPREKYFKVFQVFNKMQRIEEVNLRSSNNFILSINRYHRLISSELGKLLEIYPRDNIFNCEKITPQCLKNKKPIFFKNKYIKGNFAIFVYPPTPWAWINSNSSPPGEIFWIQLI